MVQQKDRLEAIKKAPNSISCKMATVLKKNQENKCLIFGLFFFSLSIEVFGIAGFQGHFSYISRSRFSSTFSTDGSVHVWFCCVSMCGLFFFF